MVNAAERLSWLCLHLSLISRQMLHSTRFCPIISKDFHSRKQLGPMTFEELRQLADLGQIDRKSSLGWSIGMHWIPYAALVEGLFTSPPLRIMRDLEIVAFVLDILSQLTQHKSASNYIPAKNHKKRYVFTVVTQFVQKGGLKAAKRF